MPNKAEINFSLGTYDGKNANNVYNGVVHNPQTSSAAKAMSSFSDASRNTAAGYNGAIHNPQTSIGAKSNAAAKLDGMPEG